MPYSADINSFYWDFGNGYVPFFTVIGAYNVLMSSGNSVSGATATVPDAIESFNAMGVVGPIEDFSKNFWGFEYIDVSGVFTHPDLLPITVSIQENGNPEVVNATIDGDILLITINPVIGFSNITLLGEAGGESAEHTFTVTSVNPNTTTEIGTAFGFVSGNGRDPIEGAVISAGNISTLSDESGIFYFDIDSGTYEFTCEIDGFETITIEEDITTGETTIINFDYTESEGIVPQIKTELVGNYPNPFNPVTNISYSVKDLGKVSIQIFNTKGQLVKTLVDETKDTGSYSTIWNGNDNGNKAVSSGIYFYKMKTGDKYTSTKKMILLK